MNLAYISWRVDIHREIFGIPYFPHGVLIAVGFVAGSWLMSRYTRPRGLPNEVLWDVLTCSSSGLTRKNTPETLAMLGSFGHDGLT